MGRKQAHNLKKVIWGTIVAFILIFAFAYIGRFMFFIPLFFYFLFGLLLIIWTPIYEAKGYLKFFLLTAGTGAVLFTLAMANGVFSTNIPYSFDDTLFYTTIFVSLGWYIVGVIGSLVMFKNL